MSAAKGGGRSSQPPRSPGPPLPLGKRIAFGLVAFVILPLLCLLAVEVLLRVAGVGYPTRFLKPLNIGGVLWLVENDKFGLRFFPPELARTPPPVLLSTTNRPDEVVRIFVLGESAALGDPKPAFGAPRYLQALLEKRFPGQKFEIVTAAMTAINSHALLPIARECAGLDPDLFIIYMGNNEMVGPFGPATVFGARAPGAGYVRFTLALQKLRVGQLVMDLGRKWARRDSEKGQGWRGMKMFLENKVAPGDPRKDTVYANFEYNLDQILKVTERSGASVVLNTVAVNLKDSAPFASASWDPDGRPPASTAKLLSLASDNAKEGRFQDALGFLNEALKLGPSDAETAFRIGNVLLAMTNIIESKRFFEQARDNDALPFRSDSRLEAIVQNAGKRHPDARFVHARAMFASNAPAGIPGREHFFEHVHFNPAGNYLLALAWADEVERALPALGKGAAANWASMEECDRRLGLTHWNRCVIIEEILKRLAQPPFIHQSNHEVELEYLRGRLAELRKQLTPAAAQAAADSYATNLAAHPLDYRLRESYAEFLEGAGNLVEARAAWEQVAALLPHHHVAWFHSGRLASRTGSYQQAREFMDKALAIRPDLAEAHLEIGQAFAAEGKLDEALVQYARVRELVPGDYRVPYFTGKALSRNKRGQEALEAYRQAIKMNPQYWEAHYALGEELAFAGSIEQAKRHFEEVIRRNPRFSMAHFNLGVALFQEGDRAAALRSFEEAARLDPKNTLAAEYVRKLREAGVN